MGAGAVAYRRRDGAVDSGFLCCLLQLTLGYGEAPQDVVSVFSVGDGLCPRKHGLEGKGAPFLASEPNVPIRCKYAKYSTRPKIDGACSVKAETRPNAVEGGACFQSRF